MKKNIILITITLLVFFSICIPVIHLIKTKWKETGTMRSIPQGFTDDASQLNLTPIDTIVAVSHDTIEIRNQLKEVIEYAKVNNLRISMAGARHSMGGQTMYPHGIVLNMLPYNHMSLDTITNVLTIGAGALWEDALKYLDRYRKSIAILQAFSSFSVGGSLSVNGHGWQKDLPPISASVVSFSIMNANGDLLTCSREENTELFKLVLGGYGLFGIILDVKLTVVDNVALQYHSIKLDPDNYVDTYKKYISENSNVDLVFGRLRISQKKFLEEATLNYFEKIDDSPPSLSPQKSTEAKRLVFRASNDSEYGKRLRWDLETSMNKISNNDVYSRNELLNDHVSLIENKDSLSTDLLQEYFIPERNFKTFIQDIKPILQNSSIDLLNITIRGVQKDDDTFMTYAPDNVFGFVFLFNQKKTSDQEEAMKNLTIHLYEAALKNEGTFYLPYRLHIDRIKMRESYPQADSFFAKKREYDPSEIFSNKFYDHYK